MDDKILAIREFTAFLRIGEHMACKMVQSGGLPGFKVRDQWQFRRTDINDWIDKQVRPEAPDGERDE